MQHNRHKLRTYVAEYSIVGAAFKGGRHSLQTVVWVHFWQFLKELQSVKLVARLAYISVIATS